VPNNDFVYRDQFGDSLL